MKGVPNRSTEVLASDIFSLDQDVAEGHHELLKRDFAIQVHLKFMGFSVPSSAYSEETFVPAERGKTTLSRLEVYVGSVIICLRTNGSEKVGGYRQKTVQ